MDIREHLDALLTIVRQADQAIMNVYSTDFAVIEIKQEDSSPLTQADLASNEILTKGLAELFPDIPVVSEEGDKEFNKQTVQGDMFWLADPLDGTREFVARSGQFCVALALIVDGKPQFGLFSIPTTGTVYYGGAAMGSYRKVGDGAPESIQVTTNPTKVVLGSRIDKGGATADYITEYYADYELGSMGSMLKYALIAEGKADVYPCIDRPLKLWDVASGQAVIEGAGGKLTRPDGSAVDYHNQTLLAGDFVASAI